MKESSYLGEGGGEHVEGGNWDVKVCIILDCMRTFTIVLFNLIHNYIPEISQQHTNTVN